jgi:hypothetical protein
MTQGKARTYHGDTEKKGRCQMSRSLEKNALLGLLADIQQHADAGQHHEQA